MNKKRPNYPMLRYMCSLPLLLAVSVLMTSGCETTGGSGDNAGIALEERAIVRTRELYSFPDSSELTEPPAEAIQSSPVTGRKTADEAFAGEPFRIGAGDRLSFQFYDDTTLSQEVVVRYDGYVSLPLVDDIHVAQLTRSEAEEIVRQAYEAVFREPRLSLAVRDVRSKVYYVLGEVERPDEYIYERPLSLIEAINRAGGLRVNNDSDDTYIGAQGQLTKAYIIRHQDGKRDVFEYDLRGLRYPGRHASEALVMPGDIIYLPEGLNLVYVLGEVRNPGVFPLVEGMTLLELLARSGGPLEPTARMKSVVLLRQIDAEHTEAMLIDLRKALRTGFSPRLEPGDIVYVPRSGLVKLYDHLMRFTRLTQTVTPLLDLYMTGYDAYYTDERFDRLFDDENFSTSAGTLSLFQTIRDLRLLTSP